ncbi:hypothetical protein [Ulvibacter litoralis]|uniref:SpoIIAA-like n=1 Tax=Ulvibacter litoralis TaxID=227084 RepID=A0A1G7FDM7_9FLAO|nr:hypothetical protein [Ulvibacter litoralis]GHC51609.1 hypothetical protein GCM10008083_14110 [Ulvibacter litoralis]SDE73976.1 hypothetical protein SAMN05421855_102493 [Ulvibacter litoralis]
MRIEDSIYKDKYVKKITIEIGELYFFERFIVSEINEGAHFTWTIAEKIINHAYDHYGKDIKVVYIANRINTYNINPQDWLNFYKERHHLEGLAIVAYTKLGLMNVVLEKIFTQTRLKKFNNLDDAIKWALSLEDSRNLKATNEF